MTAAAIMDAMERAVGSKHLRRALDAMERRNTALREKGADGFLRWRMPPPNWKRVGPARKKRRVARQGRDEHVDQMEIPLRGGSLNAPMGGILWPSR
jgi:hypothetical protein